MTEAQKLITDTVERLCKEHQVTALMVTRDDNTDDVHDLNNLMTAGNGSVDLVDATLMLGSMVATIAHSYDVAADGLLEEFIEGIVSTALGLLESEPVVHEAH